MSEDRLRTIKEIDVPTKIWNWVWDTLAEISHEAGAGKKGKYLLLYEGWSGECVGSVYDPAESDEENEIF